MVGTHTRAMLSGGVGKVDVGERVNPAKFLQTSGKVSLPEGSICIGRYQGGAGAWEGEEDCRLDVFKCEEEEVKNKGGGEKMD